MAIEMRYGWGLSLFVILALPIVASLASCGLA
jgi:hypothetical protein